MIDRPEPSVRVQRLHGLDAMRLLLMLLGIPYHAALIYDLEPSWLIHSTRSSVVLTDIAILLHSFRLGAFFILAGFFASLVENRQGPQIWLKGKLLQLGIPLVACMVLLTPPQIFIAALARQDSGLLDVTAAWNSVLTVASHPSKLWVLHLWFLVDLMLICCAFGLGCMLPALRQTQRWLDVAERFAVRHEAATQALLLAVFLAATLVIQLFHVVLHVPEVTLVSGLIQVQSTLYYGVFFMLGVFLRRRNGFLEWFSGFSWVNLVLAILAPVSCVLAARSSSHAAQSALMFLQTISTLCVARVLFWAAMRFAQQPNRRIRRGADAAFTVYLIHHPIVAVLGLLCVRMQFPPLASWIGIVVVATVLSLAFHDVLVARSRVLSLLFSGRLTARGIAAPSRPVTVAE